MNKFRTAILHEMMYSKPFSYQRVALNFGCSLSFRCCLIACNAERSTPVMMFVKFWRVQDKFIVCLYKIVAFLTCWLEIIGCISSHILYLKHNLLPKWIKHLPLNEFYLNFCIQFTIPILGSYLTRKSSKYTIQRGINAKFSVSNKW